MYSMDPKVHEYLERIKADKRLIFEMKRDKNLISLGLIDESRSTIKYSDTYSFLKGYRKRDSKSGKYYKVIKAVPVRVTDEEYEEILKGYLWRTRVPIKEHLDIREDRVNQIIYRFLSLIMILLGGIIIIVNIITEQSLLQLCMGVMYIFIGVIFDHIPHYKSIKTILKEINSKLT